MDKFLNMQRIALLLITLGLQSFSQVPDQSKNPGSTNLISSTPKIVFTELQVFNKPVKIGPDEPLQKPIAEAKKIVLSHEQNVFSISFTTINYNDSTHINYVFQLVGFDKGWQNSGNQRTVRYTNLDQGKYIFKVKVINSTSVLLNDNPASIEVNITPPFWETLPVKLLISLVILLIIYGLYQFRTNSIRENNKELSAMNRELNDQIYHRLKLQEQLDQAQKLDSIGTLAGGIAHDFNNLLTIIKGYSDIALINLKSKDDPVYKNLVEINNAAERAENLTNQILTFSRKQIYKPKIIEINKILRDSDKMLHRLISEDIHIEMKLGQEIPIIKADPVQIEQILINLIVNARDAINQKTRKASEKRITIETDKQFLNNSFTETHVESKEGLHVVISISDNGIGMPKEVLDKIFDPFITTKEQGKGTGLGLATVYGIVKQNSGNIYVYSEPNKGTTFKVYWKASEETAKIENKTSKKSDELFGNESLLIVEDDDDVRKFTHSALSELGYKVEIAENGMKALELVKTNKNPIDLLITDLIMPGMNGKELSEKIKSLKPTIEILFVSGYTAEHIVHSGELEKDINFMAKPYTMSTLAKKIREILGQEKL